MLKPLFTCAACLLLATAGCKKDDCDNADSPQVNMAQVKVVLLDSSTSTSLYGAGRRYSPDSVRQLYPGSSTPAADTAGEDGFLLSYYTGATASCEGVLTVTPGTADSIVVRLGSADIDTLVVFNTRDYLTEFRWNGATRISVQPEVSPSKRTIVVYK